MWRPVIFPCLGVLLIMGCFEEYTTGITRTAQLYRVPDTDCILRVLGEVPQVQGVHAMAGNNIKGRDRASMDQFIYQGNGFYVVLSVKIDPDGSILFSQDNMASSGGRKISSNEIEKTRMVMQTVESKLVAQCGMKELTSRISERVLM